MKGINVYMLSLGSNQGNPRVNLLLAEYFLILKGINVLEFSSFYASEPVGFSSQNWFVNQNLIIECIYSPDELLNVISEIEESMGRIRTESGYQDRIIDIDIILSNKNHKNNNAQVPHPRWKDRKFVTLPGEELKTYFQDITRNTKTINNDNSKIFKFL